MSFICFGHLTAEQWVDPRDFLSPHWVLKLKNAKSCVDCAFHWAALVCWNNPWWANSYLEQLIIWNKLVMLVLHEFEISKLHNKLFFFTYKRWTSQQCCFVKTSQSQISQHSPFDFVAFYNFSQPSRFSTPHIYVYRHHKPFFATII